MYNICVINNQNQYCSERDLIDYLVQTHFFSMIKETIVF